MAEQEVLLEVRDLCKNFKVRSRKIGESAQLLHALSHVNLKVYRGETLGVIGESGCGKSTLGRCIVGLHTPSWGNILRGGRGCLTTAPHIATISGLLIFIAVIGFNLVGDGIRDVMDPKMKK